MTARRRARAAALPGALETIEGVPVPPELRDPDHVVWSGSSRYRSFMRARGWLMPAAERLGGAASPFNRRRAAAVAWARENGLDSGPRQLGVWGLVDRG